jgi:hypothetical protein
MSLYPSYQNMISCQTPQETLQHFNHCLEHYQAELNEVWIESMREITQSSDSVAHHQGFYSHYQIHFTTYKGWKVYMLMTGCFASIPNEEENVQ